jgi:hypothetical protein
MSRGRTRYCCIWNILWHRPGGVWFTSSRAVAQTKMFQSQRKIIWATTRSSVTSFLKRSSTLQADHGTEYSCQAKEAEDHHAKMHTDKKKGLSFGTHRMVPHDLFEHQGDDGHAAQHPHGPHGGQKTGGDTIAFWRNAAHHRGGIG